MAVPASGSWCPRTGIKTETPRLALRPRLALSRVTEHVLIELDLMFCLLLVKLSVAALAL